MSYDDKQAEALIVYLEAENIDYLKLREMIAALRASRPVERRVEGWAVVPDDGETTYLSAHADAEEAEARRAWLDECEHLTAEVVPCTITLHDAAREEEGK